METVIEMLENKEIKEEEPKPNPIPKRKEPDEWSMITNKVKKGITLILLVVILLITIYGLVSSLFKPERNQTDVINDSLKILSAIHRIDGGGVVPKIGANQDTAWNETKS